MNASQRNISSLGMLAAVMAMSGSSYMMPDYNTSKEFIPSEIIPKGCKKYFFRKDGSFENFPLFEVDAFFTCIAMSDTKALKKFNSFNKK